MSAPSILGSRSDAVEAIVPYSHHVTNQRVVELLAEQDLCRQRIVDVGAGEGFLISVLEDHLRRTCPRDAAPVLCACDLRPELFKPRGIRCEKLAPGGPLPYEADCFDALTCVETIEHVEDQFHLVREFYRVTKSGGRAIITTPNVLNINSRLRYLHSGFTTLFDLLPLRAPDPVHLSGHIHPINFYYLAHMFYRAGFRELRVHFDRQKKSAALFAIFLYLPISMWHAGFRLHMKQKYLPLYEESRPLLAQMNRWRMLTSRTLILEAVK